MFKRWMLASAVAVLAAQAGLLDRSLKAEGANEHAYFQALVERSDHWKSYSLREAAQLGYPKNGGLASSNSTAVGLWVTYDPQNDTDPYRQDAAKVVIPSFSGGSPLGQAVDASTTTLPLPTISTNYTVGRTVKVDKEMMVVTERDLTGKLIRVTRGQHGTLPAPHAAGVNVELSNNSLPNQVRLPLGTSDGHTYLFTWDVYWTDSYVASGLTTHKAFQFSSGGDALWMEPRARYDGGSACCENGAFLANADVGAADIRSYLNPGGTSPWLATSESLMGPGVSSKEPIQPKVGSFVIKPNRWTRFWVRVEQRGNDWDYVDYWAADETVGPVQIYRRIPMSVKSKNGVSRIDKFWIEFNTSQGNYRGNPNDLVNYVRNFVALEDPGDVTSLLIRPLPGAEPDRISRPAAPTGVQLRTATN